MEVKRLTSRKLVALMWAIAAIVALNVLWTLSDQSVLPDEYLAGLSLLAVSGLGGYQMKVQGDIDKVPVPTYMFNGDDNSLKRIDKVVEEDLGLSMADQESAFSAWKEAPPIREEEEPSPGPTPPTWREAELQDLEAGRPSMG